MLNIILWLPLAIGLVGLLLPRRSVGAFATLGAIASAGLAIALIIGFETGAGLQHVVSKEWIPDLGVRYELGVDGINLFLIALTSLMWAGATAFAALRRPDRERTYFLMLGVAQTATLGAFLAQDLLLFVLFFDLMLIPFFFLVGAWGEDVPGGATRIAATTKMIVYTLIGSLLMLAAAIATAVLSADSVGAISFSFADLQANTLSVESQRWIFWFFAAAFLVKMPAVIVHGWVPDAYRAAPLPVLALLSGVLSKVAAYGFIRIVLPLFPDATIQFQEVMLIIGVASILYGSVMAFTQFNVRLIAAYSSIAQLGFITLGIFALRPEGIDGAILQSVNHGLVVVPAILIIALLAERFGSEDLRDMGGMAMRAPVLAVLFLIVTMATLAMPGSANFIGEFYILEAVFQAKAAICVIAISGVALAAFYALRMYQRSMHNRLPAGIESREISLPDGVVLGSLVAIIVGLALWPGLILERSEADTAPLLDRSSSAAAEAVGHAKVGIVAGHSHDEMHCELTVYEESAQARPSVSFAATLCGREDVPTGDSITTALDRCWKAGAKRFDARCFELRGLGRLEQFLSLDGEPVEVNGKSYATKAES